MIMHQVWKFEIPTDESPLEMPYCAQVLSVAFQSGKLMMWALVDIERNLIKRKFIVRGTGHNVRIDPLYFVGTAFTGELVFHVFELID